VSVFNPPLSLSDFRTRFPEFVDATDGFVQAKLDETDALVDPVVFGQQAYVAAYYYTADLLALSPFGQNARLTPNDDGKTTYRLQYERMMRSATFGYRNT
jgi:hypothetical protein